MPTTLENAARAEADEAREQLVSIIGYVAELAGDVSILMAEVAALSSRVERLEAESKD